MPEPFDRPPTAPRPAATPPPPRAFESVAERLRTAFADGSYAVGDRLPSERTLSQDYGVSRNTLREALRALEHAGLIHLRKGATGGAFVTGASQGAITSGLIDLFRFGAVSPPEFTEARIWLEEIVVREACARRTPEGLAELEANVDAAAAAPDFRRLAELNMEFHRILARMTDNAVVVAVMNGLLDVKERFVERLGPYETEHVLPSRRRFLAHFGAGACDEAVAEMEASLRQFLTGYLARITR
jgi:GntR family transcriptional repressor for pyruvate dehydrogenase complex